MRRIACLGIFGALVLAVAPAHAQNPPSTWHPYQGGINCIQVADKDGNFNCAPGTTINLTTGAITYTTPAGAIFPFGGAVVINAQGGSPQALGNDLVIASSPGTIAPTGPGIRGVTLRVRQGPAGTCVLVVAPGNGFQEFIIPVLLPGPQAATTSYDTPLGFPSPPGAGASIGQLLEWFPGGNLGC